MDIRKTSPVRRAAVILLLIFTVSGPALAAASNAKLTSMASAGDQALLLAGLPVEEGSILASQTQTSAFQKHAKSLGKVWAKLENKRLAPMRDWTASELQPLIQPDLPLIYFFGGPDALTPGVFFPQAPVTILCGLEPLGYIPPLEALNKDELDAGLDNIRGSIRTLVDLSFFVTKDMAKDLRKTEIKGVLPLFYVFLSRLGYRITDAHQIVIDHKGQLIDNPMGRLEEGDLRGIKVSYTRPGQDKSQEMIYFSLDMANQALPKKPGFFPFIRSLGPANALLKAASFILWDKNFTQSRDFLLANSQAVLQDDSGMPFRAFKPHEWSFHFYGQYSTPAKVFQSYTQRDLQKSWAEKGAKPLPFRIGYTHKGQDPLILAIKTASGSTRNHS